MTVRTIQYDSFIVTLLLQFSYIKKIIIAATTTLMVMIMITQLYENIIPFVLCVLLKLVKPNLFIERKAINIFIAYGTYKIFSLL